jgi:hypothetical protein
MRGIRSGRWGEFSKGRSGRTRTGRGQRGGRNSTTYGNTVVSSPREDDAGGSLAILFCDLPNDGMFNDLAFLADGKSRIEVAERRIWQSEQRQ